MNRHLVAMCGLVLVWSTLANGQSISERYAAEIDTNKDGVVSREEFLAMSRNHFTRQDKDGDHRLTGAERPGYLSAQPIITEQDYLNIGLKVFDGQDADHDGSLRGEEAKRFWEQLNQGPPPPGPQTRNRTNPSRRTGMSAKPIPEISWYDGGHLALNVDKAGTDLTLVHYEV